MATHVVIHEQHWTQPSRSAKFLPQHTRGNVQFGIRVLSPEAVEPARVHSANRRPLPGQSIGAVNGARLVGTEVVAAGGVAPGARCAIDVGARAGGKLGEGWGRSMLGRALAHTSDTNMTRHIA